VGEAIHFPCIYTYTLSESICLVWKDEKLRLKLDERCFWGPLGFGVTYWPGGWVDEGFLHFPHVFCCNCCCDLRVIVYVFRICYPQFRVSIILHLMFRNTWSGIGLKYRCGLPENERFWLRPQCNSFGCALATIYQCKLRSLICSWSMVLHLDSRLHCRSWLCLWICVPYLWFLLEQLGFRVLDWMLSCMFSVAISSLSLTCLSSLWLL
jgi:hypothetical protein